jgi:hypothetical protein
MSIVSGFTLVAPPSTVDVASETMATMAALSGVITDYNEGSQIRTQSEATGAVVEQQGVWALALAVQAIVYGAIAAFGLTANGATPSIGQVSFLTGTGMSPPAASQNVSIPQGTLVQTTGGVQFLTTVPALLPNGSSSVNVNVQAVLGGSAGNVVAGAVTQIINNLAYPLFVTNANAFTGGSNAQSASQNLARFAALRASIGLSSPGAIGSAVIGVSDPATGETVQFATLDEPWITASGAASGQAGWDLYIDNGLGTASSGLITTVNTFLNTGNVSGATNANTGVGFRDAGVPYGIFANTPVLALVAVSGTVSSLSTVAAVSGAMLAAVSGYFTLAFGTPAEQPQIAAAVANSALGLLTSLGVNLYVSGSPTPVPLVSGQPIQRVILGGLSLDLLQAT